MHDPFAPGPDFLYRRPLADGRVISVVPLVFGRARVTIGQLADTSGYDDGW